MVRIRQHDQATGGSQRATRKCGELANWRVAHQATPLATKNTSSSAIGACLDLPADLASGKSPTASPILPLDPAGAQPAVQVKDRGAEHARDARLRQLHHLADLL